MNKYDVQKVVGQGSYGRAILCKRKSDNRLCIIKQIAMGKLSRHEARMTEQEAALLHKLQHPNIVCFWESFVANANLHIVMEYADGGDLEAYIKNYTKTARGREMPEVQVLNLFVQLCLAIKHIHDRKILHRDLKCQNVFMTSSGICKLGDFGVSRVLRSTVELAATQIG
jgi:NIMA (never in mitosis gene a)-related kinase 1/4/5